MSTCQNLPSLYRTLNCVQPYFQSRWSQQQGALSRLCPWHGSTGRTVGRMYIPVNREGVGGDCLGSAFRSTEVKSSLWPPPTITLLVCQGGSITVRPLALWKNWICRRLIIYSCLSVSKSRRESTIWPQAVEICWYTFPNKQTKKSGCIRNDIKYNYVYGINRMGYWESSTSCNVWNYEFAVRIAIRQHGNSEQRRKRCLSCLQVKRCWLHSGLVAW